MKEIKRLEMQASCSMGQRDLPKRFLKELTRLTQEGGRVINIVEDSNRYKVAYYEMEIKGE